MTDNFNPAKIQYEGDDSAHGHQDDLNLKDDLNVVVIQNEASQSVYGDEYLDEYLDEYRHEYINEYRDEYQGKPSDDSVLITDLFDPDIIQASQDSQNASSDQSKIDWATSSSLNHDIIVGQVESDELTIIPGNKATLTVEIINNGTKIALFVPHVDEWLQEGQISVQPSHTRLHPGEKTSFNLLLWVPIQSSLPPHDTEFDLTVHSPAYPDQVFKQTIQVAIGSFVDLKIGRLQPDEPKLSWRTPQVTTLLPLKNDGNTPLHIAIQGEASDRASRFDFADWGHFGTSDGKQKRLLLPGQSDLCPITISTRRFRLFGMQAETVSFRIRTVYQEARQDQTLPNTKAETQTVYGKLLHQATIGPGILLAIVGSALAGMIVLGLMLLLILTAITPRLSSRLSPPQIDLGREVNYASSRAIQEITVKVSQELPKTETSIDAVMLAQVAAANNLIQAKENLASPNNTQAIATPIYIESKNTSSAEVISNPPPVEIQSTPQSAPQAALVSPHQRIAGVPIVQPGMVTLPGEQNNADSNRLIRIETTNPNTTFIVTNPPKQSESLSTQSSRSQSMVAEQAISENNQIVNPQSMTYEEMFRMIAAHYQLDWRMLAAQAYVESSFNPLALGRKGDLGLMQILPTTWQEWAPQVDAQDPFDSYSNVLVAAVYLNYLRQLFVEKGYVEQEWILIAYNWGPNQLNNFLQQGGSWDSLSEQRKKYAQDIIRIGKSLPMD